MAPPGKTLCTCVSYGCGAKTTILYEGNHAVPGQYLSNNQAKVHRRADEENDAEDEDQYMYGAPRTRRPRRQPPAPVPSSSSGPQPIYSPSPPVPPPPVPETHHGGKRRHINPPKPSPPPIELASIAKMVSLLVAWLRLHHGLSRYASNQLLKSIKLIFTTAFQQVFTELRKQDEQDDFPSIDCPIPEDVETVYRQQGLNPEIRSTACCPKCFTLYPEPVPDVCNWKLSTATQAPKCGTELWITKKGRGRERSRPAMYFHTQSFESFLQTFLSRPTIEEHLIKSYEAKKSEHGRPPPEIMRSYTDSPGWKRLDHFRISPYHTTWSLWFDYMNPWGNRIAGKNQSTGVFSLQCLDLPPGIRDLPINTYPLGLTPTGKTQDVYTLKHLLELPINEFVHLYENGTSVVTPRHPDKVETKAAVDPVIGDLGVIQKLGGQMSYSANMFCNYCEEEKKQSPGCVDGSGIRCLNVKHWKLRKDETVRALAKIWDQLPTKTAKDAHSEATGVRSTPFHKLPYWDAVRSLIIGFMHNAGSGFLADMHRNCYGIGADAAKAAAAEKAEEPGCLQHADLAESASEVEGLAEEAAESGADDQPRYPRRRPRADSTPSSDRTERGRQRSASPRYSNRSSGNDSTSSSSTSSDKSEDKSYVPTAALDGSKFNFTKEEWELICWAIKKILLPSHKGRPPSNIGQASHGKLKAEFLFTLFELIYPIILPHIFWKRGGEIGTRLIDNLYYLVAALNILDCYTTSESEADQYEQYFLAYRHTRHELFPEVSDRYNLHLALHCSPFLKFWGPYAGGGMNEFAPERKNAAFQRIPTNKDKTEIDLTMLRQTARKSLLDVKMEVNKENNELKSLIALLQPPSPSFERLEEELNSQQMADFLKRNPALSIEEYNQVFAYLAWQQLLYRSFYSMETDDNRHLPVLYREAERRTMVPFEGRVELHTCSSHTAKSAVVFRDPSVWDQLHTGHIISIFRLLVGSTPKIFFVMEKHGSLPDDILRVGSPHFTRGRNLVRVVSTIPALDTVVVELSHIISHVGILTFDNGYCGIDQRVHVVSWGGMDKGRCGFGAFAYPVQPFDAGTVLPAFPTSPPTPPPSSPPPTPQAGRSVSNIASSSSASIYPSRRGTKRQRTNDTDSVTRKRKKPNDNPDEDHEGKDTDSLGQHKKAGRPKRELLEGRSILEEKEVCERIESNAHNLWAGSKKLLGFFRRTNAVSLPICLRLFLSARSHNLSIYMRSWIDPFGMYSSYPGLVSEAISLTKTVMTESGCCDLKELSNRLASRSIPDANGLVIGPTDNLRAIGSECD
ncbi:hypothetical protein DL96DRAFT_1750365 [Flagelloscypha sp. PMI_526]|nr:hypothetical protein DL96DRAFT_1750365 [Flagelloscypha sp. PMI_526]